MNIARDLLSVGFNPKLRIGKIAGYVCVFM